MESSPLVLVYPGFWHLSKSITQYCFCHSRYAWTTKTIGAQTVSSVYLSSGQALDTPRGRTPSKKSCFISASERSLIKLAFFSPREIFLDSNLRCFWKKLASLHLRHISFFDCSEEPSARCSRIFYTVKKHFRELRSRCFGKLRFLKALLSGSS